MQSAIIDIDNDDPQSLSSEMIFLVLGFFFFFKCNCIILCDHTH